MTRMMLMFIGGIAALLSLLCALSLSSAFSYLVAFVVVLTTVLGALITMMVCDACGAVWFIVFRRIAEAVVSTLPMLMLLFVPVLLMLGRIYPWAGQPATDAHARALILARRHYLNPGAFILRAGVVFLCWIVIAELLRSCSLRQDAVPTVDLSSRRRTVASIGLMPVALTGTIAAIDWLMSLDTTWASSIVGMQLLVGSFTAGTCAIILLAAAWRRANGLDYGSDHRHALGLLLFTGVILWAYLGFMQFLVVWMGDLPDEAAWYVRRISGGWGMVALVAIALHFVIPFGVLLPRFGKRDGSALVAVAICVLCGHVVDLAWTILPAAPSWTWDETWELLVALAGITAMTYSVMMWRARGIGLCPSGDPDLTAAQAYRRTV